MVYRFDPAKESIKPHFKGGEKELRVHMEDDGLNKLLLRATLIPGASVGLHTHDDSSEIIYILEGTGKVLYDGEYTPVSAGDIHYCPKGHAHSPINDSAENLVFFAVVPQQ